MRLWVDLFFSFAKIGLLTFGGGLAMLPMLKHELVTKREWVTEDEILDFYAIGQCTPGIIAVNVATFIGYKKGNILGGIIATLGMIAPSVVIILILASLLTNFMSYPIVASALVGIRGVVCALLLHTVILLTRKSVTDIFCLLVFLSVLILEFFFGIPSVLIVVCAGGFGILVNARKKGEH